MRYNTRILLVIFFVIALGSVRAQQLPQYKLYVFDPYLINPSQIANYSKSEFNLTYRNQWAEIEDSPTSINFNYQHYATDKIQYAFQVVSDKTVLLSSTTAMGTFGYSVPLSEKSVLRFGLSAGVISNRIAYEQIEDISDPALANLNDNNFGVDGQFGISFEHDRFKAGFALLRLFETNAFIDKSFNDVKFGQLQYKTVHASYMLNLSHDLTFTPFLLYRFAEGDLNSFDLNGILTYKNTVSLGGSYIKETGPSIFLKFNIKDKYDIGYAYEFPNNITSNLAGSTHEVQIKIRLGKKIKKATAEKTPPPATNPVVVATPMATEETTEPTTENPETDDNTTNSEANQEEPANRTTGAVIVQQASSNSESTEEENEPERTYLLVVGAFQIEQNANDHVNQLLERGLDPGVYHNLANGYHYVHLKKYQTNQRSLQLLLNIRETLDLPDAWFYSKPIE